MSGEIRIDTKYARRDLERINNAITQLEGARKMYNNAIADIHEVYKGDASNHLQHLISDNKIKEVNNMIRSLTNARTALMNTINKAEAHNNQLKNLIQSSM